jgi:hypothetical protein
MQSSMRESSLLWTDNNGFFVAVASLQESRGDNCLPGRVIYSAGAVDCCLFPKPRHLGGVCDRVEVDRSF